MSETKSQYPTGVYAKGDERRVANTAAKAVALAFQGFKPVTADVEEASAAIETPVVTETPIEVADADKTPRVPAPRPTPPVKKD